MPARPDASDPAIVQAAIELADLGVWTWEPEKGTYTMSAAGARLYGLSPEQAGDAKAVVERIHPDDRPAFDAAVKQARTGKPTQWPDYRVRLPDGSQRWLKVRGRLRPGKGEMLLGTVEDATPLHRAAAARRTEQLFQLLVEGTRDYAIFMLDPQGNLATWNAGVARIYGYTADEIVGQPFSRFYQQADVDAGKPAKELETAARDGKFEEEGQRVRKDGSLFWASVLITPLRDEAGQLLGFSKITRDITERRAAAIDQEEATRLREQNQFRARFINMAAHELQTPLTPIRINLTLLHDVYGHNLDENQAKCLAIIHRNVDRLARLVDDILQAARLQADRLRLDKRPIDASALARSLVESFEDAAKQVKVSIRSQIQPDVRVVADSGRLEQVLGNLFTNALKFTPEGGQITIGVRRSGSDAVMEVSDSGIGMDPEQLKKLFQPFSQVHTEARHQRGTGLGLFISKGIIEEHGGSITASSEGPGMGSTFRIRLPATDQPVAPAPQPTRRRTIDPTAQRLRELI